MKSYKLNKTLENSTYPIEQELKKLIFASYLFDRPFGKWYDILYRAAQRTAQKQEEKTVYLLFFAGRNAD